MKSKKRDLFLKAAYNHAPSRAVAEYMAISEYNPQKRMALCEVDDWVKYSRRTTWHVTIKVLVIHDRDTNNFEGIRVSPKCYSIDDALEWIKPAEVKKAEARRVKVKRQGDFYFIPQRTWNLNQLARTHHEIWMQWGRNQAYYLVSVNEKLNGCPITITHREHGNMKLNSPHKAVQQKTVFRRGSHGID